MIRYVSMCVKYARMLRDAMKPNHVRCVCMSVMYVCTQIWYVCVCYL